MTVHKSVVIIFAILFIQQALSKDCKGTSYRLSTTVNTSAENTLKNMYTDCTVVNTNLEMTVFKEDFNTSFLDSIEEVKGYLLVAETHLTTLSMKNLRLIRGMESCHFNGVRYTFTIINNTRLQRVIFPSLRELIKGNLQFKHNPAICFINTINWEDIAYPNATNITLDQLNTNCPSCKAGCKHCWSEDVCQEVWRSSCNTKCPAGCWDEDGLQCCDSECAGGCLNNRSNCIDCKNYNDSKHCVKTCPRKTYHYGSQCVKTCPENTPTFGQSCYVTCPSGYRINYETNYCEKCPPGAPCPNVCSMTNTVRLENVRTWKNCSIINGSLKIYQRTVENGTILPLLQYLSDVTEVREKVDIQGIHDNFTELSFLRNLRFIHGHGDTTIYSMDITHTSLRSLGLTALEKISRGHIRIVDNQYLESLDLVSLKEVEGSIIVKKNRNLCYIVNDTFLNISKSSHIDVALNKDPEQCERENKTCDPECSGGCWGPGSKNCVSCKNINFEGECIASCGKYEYLYEVEEKKCNRCHPLCSGGCSGYGADKCKRCLNATDDNECVEICPVGKYKESTSGFCKQCDPSCKNGCKGATANLGEEGCNNCNLLLINGNICLDKGTCGEGFYKKSKQLWVFDTDGKAYTDFVETCNECHAQCKNCTDEGDARPGCVCLHVEIGKRCSSSCPDDHYQDEEMKCNLCHHECMDCWGPHDFNCNRCKNFIIYDNTMEISTQNDTFVEGKTGQKGNSTDVKRKFVCASECPASIDHYRCKSVYKSQEDPKASGAMIGGLVFGAICLLFVVVVIVAVMRKQKAKADENKAKLQAEMLLIESQDLEKVLTPTNVRPDLANLRLIKESDLNKGEMIGSGAFGTVYRGMWSPENEGVRVAVAIKVLVEGSSSAQHKELLEEARVMATVNHCCCIRLLAVCLARQMMLITPLLPQGSLLDYLRKNGPTLDCHTMLKWATQIAKGMNYLEQKGIVHRDLAARNILVSRINQVKITDFGLAKVLTSEDESYTSTGGKVPIKWLALESIQHRIFTHKSDVWSYGVTLWEMFTFGQRPYENISALDVPVYLEAGERLSQPSICTIDVYMLMFRCWMIDSNSRPTFQELEADFAAMSLDPKRFLVIPEDKLTRIPSNFDDDNRSKLIRQMNLSESDDFVCGEDYLDPVFTFPERISSKKTGRLISVLEEEETSFQNTPDYTNLPEQSRKHALAHQSSSTSSGSVDGTFTHLEAASVALEGGRERKPSARYLGSPSGDKDGGKILRPVSNDLKESMKKFFDQNNNSGEDYLEPLPKMEDSADSEMKFPNYFIENPEYMENACQPKDSADSEMKIPNYFIENPEYMENECQPKATDQSATGPTFGNKQNTSSLISGRPDYYNEIEDIPGNVTIIFYNKL